MKKPIIIFGTKEIATLAKFYFENDTDRKVEAFTVDDDFYNETKLEGVPIIPLSELGRHFSPSSHDAHVALSYKNMNKLREEKYYVMKKKGYKLISYISTSAVQWPDLIIGDNCFILERQVLQPNVRIGNNVTLWSGNHVGHGSRIGDNSYVSSHVVISGHCQIGKNCFIGVNSTIKDFTNIGDRVFIGMSSSVTSNMQDDTVIVAPQQRNFSADDRKAKLIKRSV